MSQKKWAEMEKLRPSELAALIQDFPVVSVPSGIYEWHDEQNPLGTDTLKMVEVCRRTARRTGGLVYMPSYIGVGGFIGPISYLKNGGLNYSERLTNLYLLELFEQLEVMGFELIVLLYGHTNLVNINAHENASRDYMLREGTKAKVLCLNDLNPVVKHRYKVADHAAKWETSFMLASYPDKVKIEAIPKDHGPWHGLDPRVYASSEEGECMYNFIAEETGKLVEMALNTSRSSLVDYSFPSTNECWKDCQNIRDLEIDFWKGDTRWEDPFCWFCYWLSPGLINTLFQLKGQSWMVERMRIWQSNSKNYTGRIRVIWSRLSAEWEAVRNK